MINYGRNNSAHQIFYVLPCIPQSPLLGWDHVTSLANGVWTEVVCTTLLVQSI